MVSFPNWNTKWVNFFRTNTKIFVCICIIFQHWCGTGIGHRYLWKVRTCLSCTVNAFLMRKYAWFLDSHIVFRYWGDYGIGTWCICTQCVNSLIFHQVFYCTAENSFNAIELQYIPRNMHTVFALPCFVMVIHWLIFPYPPGLLHWHCGNLTIAPVPAKQPWWIWINTSCEFIVNDCITTTKQSTTKPCAYFLGCTVMVGVGDYIPQSDNSSIPYHDLIYKWAPYIYGIAGIFDCFSHTWKYRRSLY